MTIVGIGVDTCDDRRVGDSPEYAKEWAIKEAVAKALGTGFGYCNVHHSEILVGHNGLGRPEVLLIGDTADRAKELGVTCHWVDIRVSVTYEAPYATAMCVIEKGKKDGTLSRSQG
jgi:holo-[acyl-carrier protein] synthase|tara:strand:- start:146 stop:493 length:348 start_codon:yes stop_codon:yes gene_type:complete